VSSCRLLTRVANLILNHFQMTTYECTLQMIFQGRYAPSLFRRFWALDEGILGGFLLFWAIAVQTRSQNTPSFQVPGLVRNLVQRVHSYSHEAWRRKRMSYSFIHTGNMQYR